MRCHLHCDERVRREDGGLGVVSVSVGMRLESQSRALSLLHGVGEESV